MRVQQLLGIIRLSYKNHTVYLYDLFGLIVSFLIRISVISLVFKALYQGATTVDGYGLGMIVWGMIFSQCLTMTRIRISAETDQDIKTGKIAMYLLNPVQYIPFKFLEVVGQSGIYALIALVIGIGAGFFIIGELTLDLVSLVGAMLGLIGGICLTFFGDMMVGLLGFFTEDAKVRKRMYSKLAMMLGGNLIPLVFLPDRLQQIAYFSPFAYTGYSAGLIFSGIPGEQTLFFLGMQVLRIIILGGLCYGLFAAGRSVLVSNGG